MQTVQCHAEIVQSLARLANDQQRIESDMRLIFSMFALTAGFPSGARLVSVDPTENTITVEVPE